MAEQEAPSSAERATLAVVLLIVLGVSACVLLFILLASLAPGLAPLRGSVPAVAFIGSACTALGILPLIPRIRAAEHSWRITDGRRRMLAAHNDTLKELNAALEQEIRERQGVEQENRVNLGRLEAIVDSLPLGAATVGEDRRVIRANQRCCDLMGLSCTWKELIGKPRESYAAQVRANMKDPAAYDAAVQEAFTSAEPVTHLLEMADGRIVERVSVPIAVEGHGGGHLFLYRDVTREERVSTSKSEFMSLASHQLRTPLTAIRWSFGRLQKSLADRLTPVESRLLEDGLDASRKMSSTIDTMLAISRIEAGKVRPSPSEIKVGAFLNDVRVSMRGLYEEKRQTFSLECPSNLLLVTDPDILEEIVANLYSNAIKYTPDGGSIRVMVAAEGAAVRIEVEDDGFGIPAHQQERVFSKFFRADNIVSADTSGTGLGLYLVSLLTKILGGTIAFRSSEGKGTVFTLHIPGI